MKKNLILMGPIGCGKSTMIQNTLGEAVGEAGGYVTLRAYDQEKLAGFDLAPASALCSRQDMRRIQRFLEFGETKIRRPEVFAGLGAELLREALRKPYAVTDEFGGLELMVHPFHTALKNLLLSPVPCIGVFKTRDASKALSCHMGLDSVYAKAYEEMLQFLREDPNTELLNTTGRYDLIAREKVTAWAHIYVRK